MKISEISKQSLLERIGGAQFIEAQWQSEPVYIRHAFSSADMSQMLDLEEVDARLMTGSVGAPDLQILRNGRAFDVGMISELSRSVDLDAFVNHFRSNGGFRWQHLENYFASVAEVAGTLQREIGYPIRANGYFSPRSSKGLAPHYDSSDVFVVQVHGAKEWRLYSDHANKTEIPLYEDRFDPIRHQVTERPTKLLLEPGDMLYVPKGHMHSAESKTDLSVHLTFAVLSISLADLIGASVRKVARDELLLRKCVPTRAGAMVITQEVTDAVSAIFSGSGFADALTASLKDVATAHAHNKPASAFSRLLS